MTKTVIEVEGLKELTKRMQAYPVELHKAMSTTTSAALLVLWENVPPYPPAPANSTYDRTGTLGRTLGSGTGGGVAGEPDIFTVKPLGKTDYEGKFGTRLDYAEHVIGDGTQAKVHQGVWWTMRTIAEKAAGKIGRLVDTLGEKMAAFLEGKGL